jgi:cytochrome P450
VLPPSAPRFDGDNQNELLAWMEGNHRRLGTTFRSEAYGASVYVTSVPQYAEHVLRRNWQNYRKGRVIKRIALLLGKGLMVSESALWKRQRRMIQPAFQDRAIDRLATTITDSNVALLCRWQQAAREARSVNVTREISALILDIILKAIFGDDYARIASHFGILSEEPERNLEFAHAFRLLGRLIIEVAADRPDDAPDMLGMLMRARDRDTGEAMSNSQLVDEILTLIVAGHETTASTLNWIWYLLSQHPDVEAKLHIDGYIDRVIEEALRLYPAGWLMTRRAIHDDKLGPYFVPAGTEIYVSPYVIGRSDIWPNPNSFDPGRFSANEVRHALAILPFSAGPRNCIGEHLARLEMRVHLSTIASKVRLRYLGDEPEVDLGVNLRSKHDFIMLPILISSCAAV